MNPVEIEEAITALADAPFDAAAFPFAFLEAFGNRPTTIKKLRNRPTNPSDIPGGVLQRNHIHMAVCAEGDVTATLDLLKASPATAKAHNRVGYVLATDGQWFEAEDLNSGDTVACAYENFPDHFGFFLSLAGITTVQAVRENTIDIRATARLNKLYIELLENNPDWGTPDRRPDMNHFMARLIFCFFAEDTDIFHGDNLFTATVEQMSARDASNTHEVMAEIFRAMSTKTAARAASGLPRWANGFPYVNGGLFSGGTDTPRFTRAARSYLIHVGRLDWQRINPDIFGSMIQAVADDGERGALGMHYTSVPNILKVLNPLFLDGLRQHLQQAGDNPRKLLNLRKRIARIRVFDPACGSGNFLVIAYKEMRAIEAEVNTRRGEPGLKSGIPPTNFRGIEIRDFPAEIARLALIIAEYQCDVLYRGQQEALTEFLPLDAANWITRGNALRLDWLSICPPTSNAVKLKAEDLLHTPLEQAEIDFENEGGETYICGNPPYRGSTWQSAEQKADLKAVFNGRVKNWKSLDYVSGWFMKAADYGTRTSATAAFVATNSICQGQQVPALWPAIFGTGHEIAFAHTSFKWANLARHNAGVTVAIVGITNRPGETRRIFSRSATGDSMSRQTGNINAYLVPGPNVTVEGSARPLFVPGTMLLGNIPVDGGHLLMTRAGAEALRRESPGAAPFVRRFLGSEEFIRGRERYCLWIGDDRLDEALKIPAIKRRIEAVREVRLASSKSATRKIANASHRFGEVRQNGTATSIVVPRVSSENREFLPVGLESEQTIIGNKNFALYDAPLWTMALIASRLHLNWIATVCGKLETRFSYSNTLGWNTFPVPPLTQKNRQDLTACAEGILLAREAHFPATVAELYDPDTMPDNLRHAHDRNDEVLERIYMGRRFRNDTERLETLFELYTTMTTGTEAGAHANA